MAKKKRNKRGFVLAKWVAIGLGAHILWRSLRRPSPALPQMPNAPVDTSENPPAVQRKRGLRVSTYL